MMLRIPVLARGSCGTAACGDPDERRLIGLAMRTRINMVAGDSGQQQMCRGQPAMALSLAAVASGPAFVCRAWVGLLSTAAPLLLGAQGLDWRHA